MSKTNLTGSCKIVCFCENWRENIEILNIEIYPLKAEMFRNNKSFSCYYLCSVCCYILLEINFVDDFPMLIHLSLISQDMVEYVNHFTDFILNFSVRHILAYHLQILCKQCKKVQLSIKSAGPWIKHAAIRQPDSP